MSALSRRTVLFGGVAAGAGAALTACTSNAPQNNAQVNTNSGTNVNAAPGQKVVIGFSAPAADHGWVAAITSNAHAQAGAYPDVELRAVEAGVDAAAQRAAISTLISQKPTVIVMLPYDGKELNAAGFDELRLPHIAVMQFPGPDGVRPGTLAERAGMSKQAMNQLLRSLEGLGYIVRSDASDEGRTRIVRFTKRGRAAYSKVYDILRDIEHEWSAELGSRHFAQLKELLSRVWEGPLVR